MRNRSRKTALTFASILALLVPASAMSGCELVADFDRSKIPAEDASAPADATSGDGSPGVDATADATIDAPTDTTGDAPADVHDDAVADASGDGSDAGCSSASDCPPPSNDCEAAACNAGVCGSTNKASGATCASNGGVVCDGSGHCVSAHCNDGVQDADETDVDCGGATCSPCADSKKCKVGSDCVDKVCGGSPLTCQPPTCTDGVQNGQETDVDCGGATCDGQGKTCADRKHCSANADCANNFCFGSNPGTCVSCSDGVKDGNETDTDCGGPQCDAQTKTCARGQGCSTAVDCGSGFCQNSTTCALRPAGTTCTASSQCASNACGVSGTGNCCTAACSPTGGACGATACDSSGACVFPPSATSCGAPACSNGFLTSGGTCNGSGTCNAGSTSACPGGVKCASATTCLSSCSSDNDCQSSSTYCSGGACVPRDGSGGTCAANDQCTSGLCGPAGTGRHCCASGTTCPATVAACGATDCNTSGACAYPGNTVAPASLQTPGDCQKVVCNGSGGGTSVDDPTDIPGPSGSTCLINPACCGPSPLTACYTHAPTGMSCTSASDPNARVCGDTTNGNIAGTCVECNTNADCVAIGKMTCTASTGVCN